MYIQDLPRSSKVEYQMAQELKRYKATYSFDARNEKEVSVRVGDMVAVRRKANGEWPNEQRWMEGRNERTGKQGEVPGNYLEFVDFFLYRSPSSLSPSPTTRKRNIQQTQDAATSSKTPPKPKPRPSSMYNKSGSKAPPVAARDKRTAEDNQQQNTQATPPAVVTRSTGSEAEGELAVPQPPPRLVKAVSPLPPIIRRRHTSGNANHRPGSASGQHTPTRPESYSDCPPPPVTPRRRPDTPSSNDFSDTSVVLPTTESRPPPVGPRVSSQRNEGFVAHEAEAVDGTTEHDLFETHFPKPTYCKHCEIV